MKSPVVPQGFKTLHKPTETWWIKEGWEQVFLSCLKDVWTPPITAAPITGGRGVVQRLPLNDGGQAIIRRYRRGGFVRHFIHDVYWDRPFRPFAELICTEIARQRGAPTVEILAAGVKHRALGLYQGMFISREATGFSNLWEWLQTKPPPTERKLTIATVARTIAQLHAAGILHVDLNLTNILVRMAEATAEALTHRLRQSADFSHSAPRTLQEESASSPTTIAKETRSSASICFISRERNFLP